MTLAGVLAWQRIALSQFPDIVPPQVTVSTSFPGASAAVVEAMSPLAKWFWIGFLPQMSIWIYMTVVGGMIVGTITAAVAGPKRAA